MGQRVVNRIVDQTSAAAGTLTIDIVTEYIDGLIIVAVAAGAAAPTGMTLSYFDESPSPGPGGLAAPGVLAATLTAPGIAGSNSCSVGIGVSGTNQFGIHLGRRMRLVGTGGAASTLRYVVYTVKYE